MYVKLLNIVTCEIISNVISGTLNCIEINDNANVLPGNTNGLKQVLFEVRNICVVQQWNCIHFSAYERIFVVLLTINQYILLNWIVCWWKIIWWKIVLLKVVYWWEILMRKPMNNARKKTVLKKVIWIH